MFSREGYKEVPKKWSFPVSKPLTGVIDQEILYWVVLICASSGFQQFAQFDLNLVHPNYPCCDKQQAEGIAQD